MGRAWRIEFEGAYYHLMSRGNDGQHIYLNAGDRRLFLETISDMSDRFEIDVFAYVLMHNHYHLLIRTNRANLTKAMHWLGTTYTRRFNNRNQKRGHLFQGRYKSILIQNDAYVMKLSCYIHRNPLKAGIVDRLVEYKWSSYRAYAYGKDAPDWLGTELILSHFKGSNRHARYRKKVQEYAGESRNIFEDLHHGIILGSKTYVDMIRSRFMPDSPDDALPQQKKIARKLTQNEISATVSKLADLEMSIDAKRLHGENKMKRDAIIFLLWRKGWMTNAEIGRLFDISYSAVSHCVRNFKGSLKRNPDLIKQLDYFNSQFKL